LIYSTSQLDALMDSGAGLDGFGPFSDHKFIALDLPSCDADQSEFVAQLPCPVIGIGKGPLAQGCDAVFPDLEQAQSTLRNIERWPMAASVLVQQLRLVERLDSARALVAESFAYATLQAGAEFKAWHSQHSASSPSAQRPNPPLDTKRAGDRLTLTLNDPANHNEIGVEMRDALCEALDLAVADPSIERVEISAEGRTFSSGGAVGEFGSVSDPATAHSIRSVRLPATRLAKLAERLHIEVNGAAIGAGAEIAAFAAHVTATPQAWFQLPELKYGLIPGAGGTVSLSRKIGRQRTCELALSMKRLSAQMALDWGLVDEIVS